MDPLAGAVIVRIFFFFQSLENFTGCYFVRCRFCFYVFRVTVAFETVKFEFVGINQNE